MARYITAPRSTKMTMKPKPLTLPCTSDDIRNALRELWPQMATARGVDGREHTPHVDGHMGVGFSLRLFGPPASEPNDITRAAYAALEDMLRALEDMGFEVTREGNEYQEGRLVLGWAACLRPYDTDLMRYRDVPNFLGPNVERRARLLRERADRDAPATPANPVAELKAILESSLKPKLGTTFTAEEDEEGLVHVTGSDGSHMMMGRSTWDAFQARGPAPAPALPSVDEPPQSPPEEDR